MKSDVLELLEFLRVRDLLVEQATSFSGKRRLQSLVPYSNPEEAESVVARVDCLRRLRDAREGLPAVGLSDLSPTLAKLDLEGTRLEAEEFMGLGKLLERIRVIHKHWDSGHTEAASVWDLVQQLEPQPHLEQTLQKTFEPTGEIKDSASSGLRKIRRERERLRSSLRGTMEKRAGDLSEGSLVTLRDGRFVLSLPQKKVRSVQGIIMDRSNTGATVYMEPLDVVEDNNRLRDKDAEEFEEIQRILLVLTLDFAVQGQSMHSGYSLLGELDDLDARAKLASRWRARPPRFSPEPRVELIQARHPLLLEARGVASQPERAFQDVIPLTLQLDPSKHMLLISGPNMGGKTVALKCVGLLTLMAQAGLCVPVEGTAHLGWFEDWVVDVGDDQSLEGDQSTFGGHLRRWAEALQAAGPNTLVLLDELGSGTDPTEGAALAQSVLEVLVEEGTLGIITTHLGDLKRYAASADGIENAKMVFDGTSGSPTYTLALGVPGDSHALEMASHLGFPQERVDRAEALLSTGERDLKKLLADVELERNNLRVQRGEVAQEYVQAQADARQAKEALERVLESRKDLRDRAARQARSILQKAQRQARELDRVHRGSQGKALKEHQAVAERQAELARLEQTPAAEFVFGPVPKEIETGKQYVAVSLGGPVIVLRVSPGEDRVLVNRLGMKVELPLSDLREMGALTQPSPTPVPRQLPEIVPPPSEIHLLGKRADEATEELDQALDRALLAGLPELRVIHGFGTGALMTAVRKLCSSHPAVKSFRTGDKGEGGGGATIVRLIDA